MIHNKGPPKQVYVDMGCNNPSLLCSTQESSQYLILRSIQGNIPLFQCTFLPFASDLVTDLNCVRQLVHRCVLPVFGVYVVIGDNGG